MNKESISDKVDEMLIRISDALIEDSEKECGVYFDFMEELPNSSNIDSFRLNNLFN